MNSSLVATSSPVAFFLGCGELAALTVTPESSDFTDSMDSAGTDLGSDAAVALEPALEDFGGSDVSTWTGSASSRAGCVVADTRVMLVSGGCGAVVLVEVEVAGAGFAEVVLVATCSAGVLVAGADVVAGADAIVGFTYTQVSCLITESFGCSA